MEVCFESSIINQKVKICTKCGIEKSILEFSIDSKKKDGFFNACKECEKKRRAIWTNKNEEKIKAYKKTYGEINKDEISQYNRDHYNKNHDYHIQRKRKYNKEASEKISEHKRKYYILHRERELLRCKKWAKLNPEKATQKSMKRYAIKKSVTIEKVDYSEILKRDGCICHICGKPVDKNDIHFDHVIPLSKGGNHSMNNIKVSHSHCNLVKSNKIL